MDERDSDVSSTATADLTEGSVFAVGAVDAEVRSRRQQLVGVLGVLMVLFVLAGWAWLRTPDRGDDAPFAATGSVPTIDMAAVTGTSGSSPSGIVVDVETSRQVLAGTRSRIRVAIRNTGNETVYWQAGGCGIPADVRIEPSGFDAAGWSSLRLGTEPAWDGQLGSLDDVLDEQDRSISSFSAQPLSMIGVAEIACPLISISEPLDPGGKLEYEASGEFRIPVGAMPAGGDYRVVARFTGSRSQRLDAQAIDPIEATVDITVVDHPARTIATIDDLVNAAVDDGRLADWLPTTVVMGQPDLQQSYRVGLTWWRAAWELWIDPKFSSGNGSLRLRIDATAESVEDARIVARGVTPDDEPGSETSRLIPDRILPATPGDEVDAAVANPNVARPGDTITVQVTDPAVEICTTIAIVYRLVDNGTLTSGILIDTDAGPGTWITAPDQVPMTIPPCQPAPSAGTFRYTIPATAPGDYLICLTRDSNVCATIEIRE